MSEGGVVSTRSIPARAAPAHADMILVPGGTFRMGSDAHYPEEAPAHSVSVDAFWIDRTPVTNRAFRKFVNANSDTKRARRDYCRTADCRGREMMKK